MKSQKKLLIAFIINLCIVVFESIGLILSINKHGLLVFQFYTELCNYFALVASFLFCIYCIIATRKKSKLPTWIHVLRFVSSAGLFITIFVVLTVLIPIQPHTFVDMMFKGSNIFQHLLCPVLSIISFIFFESETKIATKHIFAIILPTVCYGLTCIILNILKVITGPYPFFYVYAIPWFFIVLALLGVLSIVLGLSFLVLWLRNRQYKKQS